MDDQQRFGFGQSLQVQLFDGFVPLEQRVGLDFGEFVGFVACLHRILLDLNFIICNHI